MARTARPSDIYRLPEQTAAARRAAAPPPAGPPARRRPPSWLWVAVVLAVALVVSGVVGGAGAPLPGEGPLVDILTEDQAVAALALYGAQVDAIAALHERRQIFAGGGAPAAAAQAGRGAAAVQLALNAARRAPNPHPLFAGYVSSGSHVATQERLNVARETAETLALFAATHDSIYGGAGAIGLDEAHTRIQAAMGGTAPGPIKRWGGALLDQIEHRPAVNEALAAREECAQYWVALVDLVQPAAVGELQSYLGALPPGTVQGLRGHPVAGPALEHLEEMPAITPDVPTTPLPST